MPLRIVEISASEEASDGIEKTAEEQGAIDYWHSAKNNDGRRTTSILVHLDQQQELMDQIQSRLGGEKDWRLAVIPVEATIPKPEEQKENNGKPKARMIVSGRITREELYTEIERGTRLDSNFILMTLISALVAAIGLIRNDIAVIIGAMVIAPLLGPIIALAFGAALGDRLLMRTAVITNAAGLGLTLLVAIFIAAILPISLESTELLNRTYVGLDIIVLALASGAAGVLSVTTGLSGALVGVMVAVALMPPAVALGLYLGDLQWGHAYGAALMLMVNIICVSLAAQLVFFLQGIKPRTYYMRKKSEQSVKNSIVFWAGMLLTITILILVRNWLLTH